MHRITLIAAFFLASAAAAQTQPRQIQQFTEGWRFLQSDASGAESPAFDDGTWKSVTLPHDWAIAGPVEEMLPVAPQEASSLLASAGTAARSRSQNSTLRNEPSSPSMASWPTPTSTATANSSAIVPTATSASTTTSPRTSTPEKTSSLSASMTPQQPASRWYPGAGINRQVRLIITNAIHIAPWGTFVTTPTVSADSATIHVRVTVTNDSDQPATITLAPEITSPTGAHSALGQAFSLETDLPFPPTLPLTSTPKPLFPPRPLGSRTRRALLRQREASRQ